MSDAHICNINGEERRWRAWLGAGVLLDVAIWWFMVSVILGLPPAFTILFFAPAFFGFVGILEAVAGFCVFKEGLGAFSRALVPFRKQPERRDPAARALSRIIVLESFVAALALTAILAAIIIKTPHGY